MELEDKELVKKRYEIKEKEFQEMYLKVKEDVFYEKKPPSVNPIGIITGGQPGAGKSSIVIKSKREFSMKNRNPIILDGDTYRGLYKNSIELATRYPELYSEITDTATGKIMGKLIGETIDKRI